MGLGLGPIRLSVQTNLGDNEGPKTNTPHDPSFILLVSRQNTPECETFLQARLQRATAGKM